jgi:hypothetical protein
VDKAFFIIPRILLVTEESGVGYANTLNKLMLGLNYPAPDSSPDEKNRDQNDSFLTFFNNL